MAEFDVSFESTNELNAKFDAYVPGGSVVSGNTNILGIGLPTSSVVADVGDLYTDTNTNNMYQCISYTPTGSAEISKITDAKGYSFVFGNTVYVDENALQEIADDQGDDLVVFFVDFTNWGALNYKRISFDTYSKKIYADETEFYNYGSKSWINYNFMGITVSGGTDTTNPIVLEFLKSAASASGSGSQWIKITELPKVTVSDAGKVLAVNEFGVWVKKEPSGGGGITVDLIGEFTGSWFNCQGGTINFTKPFTDYKFLRICTRQDENSNTWQTELYVPEIVTQEMQLYSDNLVFLRYGTINGLRFSSENNNMWSTGNSGQLKKLKVYGIK